MSLLLPPGPEARREDLAGLAAVSVGLLVFARSGVGMPGWLGVGLAVVGLGVALVGVLVSPKAGLVGVVATLPLFLFPRQFGSQSIALHEAMLVVTTAALGLRAGTSRLLGKRRGPAPSPNPSPACGRGGDALSLSPLFSETGTPSPGS